MQRSGRGPGRGGGEVARAGFEPATFHFSGERCYQLSYLALRPPAVRALLRTLLTND
jgi:hypothetical protein